MKKYETVIVLAPEVEEQEQKNFCEKLGAIIKENGGAVEGIDFWGKKKLAYPINKKEEGNYICMTYRTDGERVKELERVLRVTETVLRFLTVKIKEKKVKVRKEKPQTISSTAEKEA